MGKREKREEEKEEESSYQETRPGRGSGGKALLPLLFSVLLTSLHHITSIFNDIFIFIPFGNEDDFRASEKERRERSRIPSSRKQLNRLLNSGSASTSTSTSFF